MQSKQAGTNARLIVGAVDDVHEVGPLINAAAKREIRISVSRDPSAPVTVSRSVPEAELWAWMREQIISNPMKAAQMTGIEQIGYLTDLQKPAASPTLPELIETYAAKPGITPEEVTRCRRFWQEFSDIVGVATIRELKHDQVEAYEKHVSELDLAPKSIKHRYTRIKTVIAHALKRGKGQADCRAALDKLLMLEMENANSLNPDPIRPEDFWKIHAAAVEAGDKMFAALMLFSVNAALYPSEVGAVRWEHIDLERGEFTTRRNKTGVPRVAVLWPETVRALKALPKDKATVFNTCRQPYARFSVFRDWTKYRIAAKLPGVTFNQIRDYSFTTACRISSDEARILAGHKLPGAADSYVLRQPQFVAKVCEAIHDALYAKPAKKKKGK